MGGSKTKTKTKSRTENTISPWLRQGSQDAVARARQINNRAYEGYDQQRIADMSENERMGIEMARSNVGAWEGDFASARNQLENVGWMTDEGALDAYMNPYMEQVVSPTLRRRNEAFEAERAGRRAQRGMSGAFGGRGQMWENQFESDFQRDQDEFMGEAYGRAFDVATGLFGEEQDRRMAMAGAYQDLGTGAQQQRRQDLRDLMASGLVERTRDQADLDFRYLEHIEERDWDIQNLDVLVRTLQSVPYETTTTSESTQTVEKKDSPMKTLAGVAATVGGAFMTGGMSLATMGGALGQAGMGMLGGGGGGG